jgi:hypothetical protein
MEGLVEEAGRSAPNTVVRASTKRQIGATVNQPRILQEALWLVLKRVRPMRRIALHAVHVHLDKSAFGNMISSELHVLCGFPDRHGDDREQPESLSKAGLQASLTAVYRRTSVSHTCAVHFMFVSVHKPNSGGVKAGACR